jgi:hypothetical protein
MPIGVNLTLNSVRDCCLTIKLRSPRILAPYSPLRRGGQESSQSQPLLTPYSLLKGDLGGSRLG